MDWRDYIVEDPRVMGGKPVFKDTRLTVEHILDELGNGMSEAELLSVYPRLKPEHLRAAFAYAASSLRLERLVAGD